MVYKRWDNVRYMTCTTSHILMITILSIFSHEMYCSHLKCTEHILTFFVAGLRDGVLVGLETVGDNEG